MSILIKGMEMPKGCITCTFKSDSLFNRTMWCEWLDDPLGDYSKCDEKWRHPDCPLVKVPTFHGRLIDADELYEKISLLFQDVNSTEDFMGIGYNHGVGDSIAIIKNAPTIEAEPVKHGRWEKIGHIENTWLISKCSECGYQTIDAGSYCTNCGAKMDTEEGENHE